MLRKMELKTLWNLRHCDALMRPQMEESRVSTRDIVTKALPYSIMVGKCKGEKNLMQGIARGDIEEIEKGGKTFYTYTYLNSILFLFFIFFMKIHEIS